MEVKYKIGEKVKLILYETDSLNIKYEKIVEGTVVQVTDKIITIDNGIFKETYQLNQLIKENEIQPNDPYDLDEEIYIEDIIEDCITTLNRGKYGYLFNLNQVNTLKEKIGNEIEVENKNGVFRVKLCSAKDRLSSGW